MTNQTIAQKTNHQIITGSTQPSTICAEQPLLFDDSIIQAIEQKTNGRDISQTIQSIITRQVIARKTAQILIEAIVQETNGRDISQTIQSIITRQVIARKTAQILIETEAILFQPDTPFILTSGEKSPVYVDCRKLIAFADARQQLMKMGGEVLQQAGIADSFDVVAGGETAGIPYGAWMADVLHKPMAYIRKKPKGFGRGARIEGNMQAGDNVLLVEDMTTDGGSKVSFVESIRDAGATCHHCFVIFSYGIFPQRIAELHQKHGVVLHYLATWADVIAYAEKTTYFANESDLNSVKQFLENPTHWRTDNT